MPLVAYVRYVERLVELEASDPNVDWSDEPRLDGRQRSVALWASDIGSSQPSLQPTT
jgi:hypothetical protein